MPELSKKSIFRAFKLSGLGIRTDAMEAVASVLRREDNPQERLKDVISTIKTALERRMAKRAIVDLAVVEDVIQELTMNDDDRAQEALSIVSAFTLPQLRLDPVRKHFHLVPEASRTLHGTAQDRSAMLRDRFSLLRYRLMNSEIFGRSEFSRMLSFQGQSVVAADQEADGLYDSEGAKAVENMEVSGIDSLVGTSDRRVLLGLLTRRADGYLWLEDLNGAVRCNISHARSSTGYFCLGVIVLAWGHMEEGESTFLVSQLAFPPAESREESLRTICASLRSGPERVAACVGFAPREEQNLRLLESSDEGNTNFAVLCEVHLDNPVVMAKLRHMFNKYSEASFFPRLIVLCGNFSSEPLGLSDASAARLRENFRALGTLIGSFPSLAAQTRFLLVPGPADPTCGASGVLPQHPLPSFFVRELTLAAQRVLDGIRGGKGRMDGGEGEEGKGEGGKEGGIKIRVTATSNPCRIRYYTQEVVIFRQDLTRRLRRHCVITPSMETRNYEEGKGEEDDDHDGPVDVIDEEEEEEEEDDDDNEEGRWKEKEGEKKRRKKGGMVIQKQPMHHHLLKTVVDQMHLCPLPVATQPVFWCYDNALRLFPLPQLIILAEPGTQWCSRYQGSQGANAGSFSTDYSFVMYDVQNRRVEFNTLL